ncbi:MAG TPA: glycosyltransferase, partial [Paracoccaceae bacterium]|nr:glycosyltransferase [Paracoccaceae bacterium]
EATKDTMRAPISILIPTLNAEAVLPDILSSLMEGLDAGLLRELIVADQGSTDSTVAMARAAGAEVVAGDLADAGGVARGAWLLIVSPNVRLGQGWAKSVATHLKDQEAAGYFPLQGAGAGIWQRLIGPRPSDHAVLLPRALWLDLGGVTGPALIRALKGRLVLLDAKAEQV